MQNEFKRPVWVEVDLEKIKFNLQQVKARVSGGTLVMAVVKADAYGHGAIRVAKAALEAGADRLAVALPEEGVQLRNADIDVPIHVLGEVLEEQIPFIIEYDLIPTISKLKTAEMLNQLSRHKSVKQKVHLKVDTGMGRIGILPAKIVDFTKKINELSYLEIEGLMTHFAKADEADKEYTRKQWQRFNRVSDELNEVGINIPIRHCANSATIIDLPEMEMDMVREGIMLYGLRPSGKVDQSFKLKPALTWKTRVVYLKEVDKGSGISYGATYVTPGKAKIATLPLGYADGYFRLLSNCAEVLIKGERVPIRGRICMDQFMVEVTQLPGVKVGDEVVLIGKQGKEEITAMELADLANTINYEIVSGITNRVPRVFV